MIKEIPSGEESKKETICGERGEKIQIMVEISNLSVADRYTDTALYIKTPSNGL